MFNLHHESIIVEPIEKNGRLSVCLVKSKGNMVNVNDTIVIKTHQIIKREVSVGKILSVKEKHILGLMVNK